MSVYNSDAFRERVNYAALCFVRDTHSRAFDTCFEMADGDAVVVALVRRARKNPKLRDAIARGWSDLREGLPVSWVDKAEQAATVSDSDLPALAAKLREAFYTHHNLTPRAAIAKAESRA